MKSCCSPSRGESNGAVPPAPPPPTANTATKPSGRDRMKLIKGGSFAMGNDRDYGFAADGEEPVHDVTLADFYLDATTVTNREFNDFVNATGYRTESEHFGWSFVFEGLLTAKQLSTQPRRAVGTEWWCALPGATWRHPEGPGSNIKKRWEHPVVHVTWNDAAAFAAWAGKRLPTEAEWEYAARGGQPTGNRFPWGDELEPGGKHRMNVWQGLFPTQNTEADGHYGTAPAPSYRANGYGLYQVTGNVWEWCADWFDADYYARSPIANPPGPTSGDRRVMRGGSFLCHASYCNRYRVDARSSNTPDSAASNIGFRCAATP